MPEVVVKVPVLKSNIFDPSSNFIALLSAYKTIAPSLPIKVLPVMLNPAILPPVNSTLDPVMSPLAFTLNFDALIKNSSFVAEPEI